MVLVGENPASQAVRAQNKNKAAHEIGIYSEQHNLDKSASEAEVLALVGQAERRIRRSTGSWSSLPLPKQIDEKKVLNLIHPDKDVDGFHPMNLGRMMIGETGFLPCTPHGVVKMLWHTSKASKPQGSHVVVVGRSNIVGKPVANMLLQKAERRQRHRDGLSLPHQGSACGYPAGGHPDRRHRAAGVHHRRHGQRGSGGHRRGSQPSG